MFLDLKDGGKLHYEVHGDSGEWLVILNGIMMSTASWADFVEPFSRNFRLLLVDFRDQGKSSKLEGEKYDCSFHVSDLIELMDHLEIDKINMTGVSYGGQVALEFAKLQPERLKTLQLVTIIPKVNNYLTALGNSWESAAALEDGEEFFKIAIPPIYSDVFYENNFEWLENRQRMFKDALTKPWFDSFIRLSKSAKKFDRTDVLDTINVPTLVLCGEKDIITPAALMKKMAEKIPDSTILIIPETGHAAFLEKPSEFITAITGFVISNQ